MCNVFIVIIILLATTILIGSMFVSEKLSKRRYMRYIIYKQHKKHKLDNDHQLFLEKLIKEVEEKHKEVLG